MSVSKAQQKAVAKYTKENYDEIKVRVPKGEKERVQVAAAASGESVNSFIGRLIAQELFRLQVSGVVSISESNTDEPGGQVE